MSTFIADVAVFDGHQVRPSSGVRLVDGVIDVVVHGTGATLLRG